MPDLERVSMSDILCSLSVKKEFMFFTKVVTALPIRYTKRVPILGVELTPQGYALLVNEEGVDSIPSLDFLTMIIEHEVHHIILEHGARIAQKMREAAERDLGSYAREAALIAADLATNSLLRGYSRHSQFLYDKNHGGLVPGKAPFDMFRDRLTFEQYFELLCKKAEKNNKNFQNLLQLIQQAKSVCQGQSDDFREGFVRGYTEETLASESESESESGSATQEPSSKNMEGKTKDYQEGFCRGQEYAKALNQERAHPGPSFDPLMEANEDFQKLSVDEANLALNQASAQMRDSIARAVSETTRSRGTIPDHLKALIQQLEPPTVPWVVLLRNAIINAIRTTKKRSLRRPNRRGFGIPGGFHFPGSVKDQTFEVVFIIDTSGSMGQAELGQALGELDALRKLNKSMTITVIEADVTIHKEYELKPGQEVQRQVLGRGGTDFNLSLARAKELRPGICFYFTDGYGGGVASENHLKCPFFWIVTPHGTTPDSWGRCIFTNPGGAHAKRY